MTETATVQVPLRVTFVIRRDRSGDYFGNLREFPGFISQGSSRAVVKRRLVALLRETSRTHPEELPLFR
ncbi:MAG: type II toxin-antitoxin system HicB family antitoxin [Planctomycetes bacterium]|nr:type II toxin-antitoxin system HicB family antitoxin [Planctomycetota bacterium]